MSEKREVCPKLNLQRYIKSFRVPTVLEKGDRRF
jgi:hypothetical protein